MPLNLHLSFGTRGSALAQLQTDLVASALQNAFTNLSVKSTIFSTKGDRELRNPLPEIGGKGLFTAELESALLSNEIDLAVHSLKDLPTETPPGLTVGAVLPRQNPADALISRQGHNLAGLPPGASIGTSSLRRKAQLLAYRPDFNIISLRGNVDTRINKALDPTGPYDAIVLACAGLIRMNLEGHISQEIPPQIMLPAPGQGAVAVQCRADDTETLAMLARIHHQPTWQAVVAERALLAQLGGGCSLPLGALAQINGKTLSLEAIIVSLDGTQTVRMKADGPANEAGQIGKALAQKMLNSGARAILEAING